MMSDPLVLIVSTVADVATDDIVRRLAKRAIPYYRLNSEDYPFARSFTYRPQPAALVLDGKAISAPTTIWYRRVRTPAKPEGMDDGVYAFCLQEQRAALLGSVMVSASRWMSHPGAVWQAEYKPYQLSLAAKLGFVIPRTVITNDPATIRSTHAEFKTMIVKPTRTGYFRHQGQDFAIFTSRVLEAHLDEIESARWSPAIYPPMATSKSPTCGQVKIPHPGRQYDGNLLTMGSEIQAYSFFIRKLSVCSPSAGQRLV